MTAACQVTPESGARRALCRAVPPTFDRAVTQAIPSSSIRVDIAQAQHRAYVNALNLLGLQVQVLPPDAAFPDSCFVEDCAVYADGVALITRPGAPSRRGEEQAVAEALAPHARLEWLEAPATLDGGDCLRMGKRWYVGRSGRTNAAGVAGMRRVFEPLGFEVTEVPLGPILHLKCVCAPLNDDTLLLAETTLPPQCFGAACVIMVPAAESYAANCLSVGGTVLMPAGFPVTRRLIEAEASQVIELEMSEIRKADGSMTCLSILYQ
jgi:dimethylargininase